MILAHDGAPKLWPKWPLAQVADLMKTNNPYCVRVVEVDGDHHVHLTTPHVVAPYASEFLLSPLDALKRADDAPAVEHEAAKL